MFLFHVSWNYSPEVSDSLLPSLKLHSCFVYFTCVILQSHHDHHKHVPVLSEAHCDCGLQSGCVELTSTVSVWSVHVTPVMPRCVTSWFKSAHRWTDTVKVEVDHGGFPALGVKSLCLCF